jgi:protein gp37
MGASTAIAWTDATWNCWQGCHKVSAGCKNCYMFTDKKRYGQTPDVVIRSAAATFNAPLKWAKNREKYGHINRVFVDSWSDFFIEEADAWRAEAWAIIRQTPNLTYQLCTKRPERIAACLPADWGTGYPNVWLMVTAENQPMADLRIPILLRIPAVVHGVSVEPMVGPVRLDRIGEEPEGYLNALAAVVHCDGRGTKSITGLDWVICGGESGPNARPMLPEWAESLRDQCAVTGTPFFFKQWGEWAPGACAGSLPSRTERTATWWDGRWLYDSLTPRQSEELHRDDAPDVYRVGKEAAGAMLDGREWKEFPVLGAINA